MSFVPPVQEVVEADGTRVRLGARLGQGGEGAIYELEDRQGVVAKIFHQPLPEQQAEKIRAMVALRTLALDRLTAWPIELLSLPGGRPIGVKVPRVVGHREIHQLYSPKSRRSAFPHADWRFLVRASANVARAFATVHAEGAVIADVNQGGILVGADARVRLIDCESFQITAGGRCLPGDVGVPIFTPPELQDRMLTGAIRSENHDNFGLAVMIFLVLFMGRHPFAGRYLGEGDMPIERAIKEHRFAYGAEHDFAAMEQPPGTPPLDIVSPPVAELFERAFTMSAPRGGRPTAVEWIDALETLAGELKECPIGIAHWHFAGLPGCPWCRIEAATGVPLFSSAMSEATADLFDLSAFWNQVIAIEHPGPAPDVTAQAKQPSLSPVARRLLFRRGWHGTIALLLAAIPAGLSFSVALPPLSRSLFFLGAIVLYVLLRLILRRTVDTRPFVAREYESRQLWESTLAEWEAKAGSRQFDDKRRDLEKLRDWWDEAASQPQQRARIEAAIRRAFDELQEIVSQIQFARNSLRENAVATYELLLQTQFDLAAVRKKR
ncbi:helix-hairpin-helix domain-containing protein [Reyranella sp.]|uniref:helix-hairpin-helix domain-containing protein n=1 Tax=Reyranella sp. TaxID=1929291 RepID=UPI003D14D833